MPKPTRQEIVGARGWEVNSLGHVFKNRRRQPISHNIAGLPTVNLGDDYRGPLRPMGDVDLWRSDYFEDDYLSEDNPGDRLLDEIVTLAFHGKPPCHYRWVRVHHLDGDEHNCVAANLSWVIDAEYDLAVMRGHMRPGTLSRHNDHGELPTRGLQRLDFVGSNNIPGWQATNHQAKVKDIA